MTSPDIHRGFARPDPAGSDAPVVAFLDVADGLDAVAAYRARLRAVLAPRPGGTVLDVGCGTGGHTALVAGGHDGPVLGLDRPAMLAHAVAGHGAAGHGAARPVRWVAGDAGALPLAGGTVDAVLVERVLMYVDDAARVVAETVRVLAPGGRLAAFELDYAGMVLGGDAATADRVHAVVRATVADDRMGRRLGPLLAAAGFVDLTTTTVSLPIPPPLFAMAVRAPAEAAVADGRLPGDDVAAWLAAGDAPGAFPGAVPGVLVAGRRP